jgi:hypothetical protein
MNYNDAYELDKQRRESPFSAEARISQARRESALSAVSFARKHGLNQKRLLGVVQRVSGLAAQAWQVHDASDGEADQLIVEGKNKRGFENSRLVTLEEIRRALR